MSKEIKSIKINDEEYEIVDKIEICDLRQVTDNMQYHEAIFVIGNIIYCLDKK